MQRASRGLTSLTQVRVHRVKSGLRDSDRHRARVERPVERKRRERD